MGFTHLKEERLCGRDSREESRAGIKVTAPMTYSFCEGSHTAPVLLLVLGVAISQPWAQTVSKTHPTVREVEARDQGT